MNRETIIKIMIVIVSIVLLLQIVLLINYDKIIEEKPVDENKEKEPEKITIGKEINLNEHDSNVLITEGGTYTISGEFNYSIIVDAKEKVTLNLNGVNIDSKITSAIANRGSSEMVVHIVEGTTNTLKDIGSSEFDGCIYSSSKLVVEGSGILKVYGNQDDGEGIATRNADMDINGGEIYIEANDDGLNIGGKGGIITINGGNINILAKGDGIDSNGGLIINGGNIYAVGTTKGGNSSIDIDTTFEINGGTLIALGTDMIQYPQKTSKQKYVGYTQKSKINKGSKIILKNGTKEIMSFTANEEFRMMLLSNSKMTNGTYDLYVDGNKIENIYTIK